MKLARANNMNALRDALTGVGGGKGGGGSKKNKGGKTKTTTKMKDKTSSKKKKKKGKGKKSDVLAALKNKLGRVVSQKQQEEALRANAMGAGLDVIDVETTASGQQANASSSVALKTIGSCPLVAPVVLGDATREVPIAMVEICTGKDCAKRGARDIVDALQGELPRGWACKGSGKCISSCKRGVNARLHTAIGSEKFSYLDEASARALFVPMALATNELNASFDEDFEPASPRGRRKSAILHEAEEISKRVETNFETSVPSGFMPKLT
jgi:hypothetical protein